MEHLLNLRDSSILNGTHEIRAAQESLDVHLLFADVSFFVDPQVGRIWSDYQDGDAYTETWDTANEVFA